MALPLLLSMAAFSGLWIVESHFVEWGLILLSMGIAIYALLPSYKKHGSHWPLSTSLLGFVLLFVGTFVIHSHDHAILNPIGGFLVAIAHILNWRFLQQAGTKKP